jgi:peptidoglycan/LPS O-acetylase OafA/YrhL
LILVGNPIIRLDIQGLRALAIIGVVVFHIDKSILPGGFTGVDIFFVISGFILSSMILNQKENFSWSDFYWGRIKRIMPAYFVMLAIVSIAAAILFITHDFAAYKSSFLSAGRFSSNIFFGNFGDYFAPLSTEMPLLHTWSLAIEIQIYFLLPLFLIFTPLRYIKIALPIFIALGLLYGEWQLSSSNSTQKVYFSLLARAHEFLFGSMIAVFYLNSNWKPLARTVAGHVGLLLIVASYFMKIEHQFPGLRSLIPCLGAALVIMAHGEGFFSQFLSRKWMVLLGGMSYSIYLWHWPILSFIRYVTQTYDLNVWGLVLFISLTASLSWISWKLIELPARQFTFYRSIRTRKTYVWLAALLVPLLGSSALNAKMTPITLPESLRYASPESICHGKIVSTCLRGAVAIEPVALVMGDSHAAQLNHFFDVVGNDKNFSVRLVSASSCVPIANFDVRRIPKWSQQECSNQIDFANSLISSSKTIIVAAKWSYHIQSQDFLKAFELFLIQAEQKNQKIIVMAQIPILDGNPIRSVRFRHLGLADNTVKTRDTLKSNKIIEKLLVRFTNAQYLDYTGSIFFNELPFYEGEAIYMDSHHLNEIGSKAYGKAVAADLYSKVVLTQSVH